MRDEDILSAARAVHPNRELDELLARADAGERVTGEILDLLTADPALWDEFRQHVPDRPEYRQAAAYADLPGDSDPSAEIVCRCPACQYEHPVYEIGEPVPDRCPRCNSPLWRA